MLKLVLFGFVLISHHVITHQQPQQQQCKVVWNEQNQGPGVQISGIKGDPGITGRPGEVGPRGQRGPRGKKGNRGPAADNEELMVLFTELTNKVERLETALQNSSDSYEALKKELDQLQEEQKYSSNRVDSLIHFGHSESCERSPFEGRQILLTGEEAFCKDGWQVFQRRYDGSVSFDRDWIEYKNGFGDLSTEFWMGLEKLHQITNASSRCRLRIHLWDFYGDQGFADYSTFRIGDEASSYQITISGYSGNIGDAMNRYQDTNGMRFTTRDRDNDARPGVNCAVCCGGGGWLTGCGYVRLNGVWSRTSTGHNAMSWFLWKKTYGGLKSSEMKVKCE